MSKRSNGKLSRKPDQMLKGNLAMDQHPIQGGSSVLFVASCRGNREKLRLGGPLDSTIDFTLLFFKNETMKLTDTTTELLRYALGDIEEPFSAELEESAKSMTACLKNVLQSTSRSNNASGYSTENTITLTEKVW